MVTLKLAQVALFLDKLDVVVLAVESSLMRNVVRRADRTPSMAALETALVVRSPVYCHLFSWIDSILAAKAFISGSPKHTCDFSHCRFVSIQGFFWFHDFWCAFKALVKTASSFEELIKVWPAVEYPLKGIVVAELEGAFAVVATETGFVVNPIISSQLVNKIDSFVTGHALLGCPCKCHVCVFFSFHFWI